MTKKSHARVTRDNKPAPVPLRAAVMVATPCYTHMIAHQFVFSYQQSFTDCMRNGIVLAPEFAVGFSLVQYARNWLVKRFLEEPQFTHLMWVDGDLGWDHTAIRRMIFADKDVIGAAYTTKSPTKPTYPFVACGPVEDGIQEAASLPGGFLLMKRAAVQALWDASEEYLLEHGGQDFVVRNVCDTEMVTMDEKGVPTRRLLGEDYVMQVKLRALGFKLWLMTDVDFVHVGMHEWGANVAKAYKAEQEAGLKTMWHPNAWAKPEQLRTKFEPDETRPVLCVPEQEVPTPNTLDLQKIVSEADPKAVSKLIVP